MISSIELQRTTPVLPQWDLGIVLEALSKPPYKSIREVSLKYLTWKTVLLKAMASDGRRSELQALVFDPTYIQFKPKGTGSLFILAPISCTRTRNLIKSTTPGTYPIGPY